MFLNTYEQGESEEYSFGWQRWPPGVAGPCHPLRWPASTLLRLGGKDEQSAARDPGRTA